MFAKNKNNTSWGNVADWYNKLFEKDGTYQKDLILPNLLRLMDIQRGEIIFDLACGQGFFAGEFLKKGARVIGADISRELINIARRNSPQNGVFHIAAADSLPFIKNNSVDKIAIILAIQNIENVAGVFCESARILKKSGSFYLVLNHPAFRVPKASSWGWDESAKIQYRRVDKYLSESKIKIQMRPGDKPDEYTTSFHRPLQYYFKALNKAGFCVSALEEWNSRKKSEPGPRAKAEDIARKEIPLFLCLVARKL